MVLKLSLTMLEDIQTAYATINNVFDIILQKLKTFVLPFVFQLIKLLLQVLQKLQLFLAEFQHHTKPSYNPSEPQHNVPMDVSQKITFLPSSYEPLLKSSFNTQGVPTERLLQKKHSRKTNLLSHQFHHVSILHHLLTSKLNYMI